MTAGNFARIRIGVITLLLYIGVSLQISSNSYWPGALLPTWAQPAIATGISKLKMALPLLDMDTDGSRPVADSRLDGKLVLG